MAVCDSGEWCLCDSSVNGDSGDCCVLYCDDSGYCVGCASVVTVVTVGCGCGLWLWVVAVGCNWVVTVVTVMPVMTVFGDVVSARLFGDGGNCGACDACW